MNLRTLAGAAALALTAAANAQFNAGDLFVNTINQGGTAARTSSGNLATVQRFDFVSNAFAQQYATGVINSGTATSEGTLQYDPTSDTLWLAGYTSVATSGGVTSTTSASNPRLAARLASTGAVTTFNTTTDYSGNNIRSAVGINGAIYTAGAGTNGGARTYAAPSAGSLGTGTIQSGSITNTRVASFYDGNVYYSTQSGTSPGVFLGGSTPTQLVTSPSAYQFRFSLDGLKTLYVADDSSPTSTTLGGISKYVLSGGVYTLAGTYKLPGIAANSLTTARYFALRPFLQNGVQQTQIIAATTEDTGTVGNRIVAFNDDNSFAAPTGYVTLATAGANEVFRGVEVVPEPASLAILGVGALGLLRRRRAR